MGYIYRNMLTDKSDICCGCFIKGQLAALFMRCTVLQIQELCWTWDLCSLNAWAYLCFLFWTSVFPSLELAFWKMWEQAHRAVRRCLCCKSTAINCAFERMFVGIFANMFVTAGEGNHVNIFLLMFEFVGGKKVWQCVRVARKTQEL